MQNEKDTYYIGFQDIQIDEENVLLQSGGSRFGFSEIGVFGNVFSAKVYIDLQQVDSMKRRLFEESRQYKWDNLY